MSTTVITRYNAFIPEPTKAGHYSCPKCYRLTKPPSATGTITCAHCATVAPVLGAATTVKVLEFVYSNVLTVVCPKCGYNTTVTNQPYAAKCSYCSFTGPVSYRGVCNACLIKGVFSQAAYVCSSPSKNHSAGHNSGLTVAGKCGGHRCLVTCTKI